MKTSPLSTSLRLSILLLAALAVFGCEEQIQEDDAGGVLLRVELISSPIRIGVNDQDIVQIPTIDIDSVILNPNQSTSPLMDVLVNTMEVTFTRADTGTRVPVPYVVQLLGTVPVGGTLTYSNAPIMSIDQMRNPPLSDLLFENGGFDQETGEEYIRLNATIRIYGRTIGGEDVVSAPRAETFEFVPSLLTNF